jgi:hypothetical protein
MSVLDTRALPCHDEIVTQWKIQWLNVPKNQATWEGKFFIKDVFSEFYTKTICEWWPQNDSRGQESSQGGGSCQNTKLLTNN